MVSAYCLTGGRPSSIPGAPAWRLRAWLLTLAVTVFGSMAIVRTGSVMELDIKLPFQTTTGLIVVGGLTVMLSREPGLRRCVVALVAVALAIYSTTWGFLYDLHYQDRFVVVQTDTGETLGHASRELTHAEGERLATLLSFYGAGAICLLIAVALAVVHQHQRRHRPPAPAARVAPRSPASSV